jgi:CBS domain-containing protein
MTLRHRLVGELMTTSVVTVRPDTSFKEIARMLAGDDVSAVPVVDDQDRPLGIVSEADLMRHQAAAEDPEGLLPPAGFSPEQQARADGTRADELMSAPAVCARPDWTVVEAARVLNDKALKRMPVEDEAGRLIGIVSRSDLLRVFLRNDRAIGEEIREDVVVRTLRLPVDGVRVDVAQGQVSLSGAVELRSERDILVRLCRAVDGVVSVASTVEYRTDDIAIPGAAVSAR